METLRKPGIKTFVYTNQSTAVMENLHQFAAACCTMEGLCTITRQENRWGDEEPTKVMDFLNTLQTNIATVIKQGDTLSPEVIDERLRELQKELVKKANQKDDYDAIADEILRLRDMRKQAGVTIEIKA